MVFNIVVTVAVVFSLIHLLVFYRFAFRFQGRYPELWRALDCPEPFGIRGQMTYLAVVLGLERKAPLQALQEVRNEVIVMRIAFAIAFAAYVVTFAWLG